MRSDCNLLIKLSFLISFCLSIRCFILSYFDKLDEILGASYFSFLLSRISFYCLTFINAAGRGLNAISSSYCSYYSIDSYYFLFFPFIASLASDYYSSTYTWSSYEFSYFLLSFVTTALSACLRILFF